MTATPWAVLLCRYQDDKTEPYPVSRFEELFTAGGDGKDNMVQFFRDCSHGRVDLSGSEVFGWVDLPMKRSDYTGSGANPAGRRDLIKSAIAAGEAQQPSFRRADFFNVVIVPNLPTDLFGGPHGVVADDGRLPIIGISGLSPSLLGQEMGHAYGLNHSRGPQSVPQNPDYGDQWDIMSTASALMAPHPFFTERDVQARPIFRIGPGLNAANMDALGWLNQGRVYTLDTYAVEQSVTLRPLHRMDLPGYLCAKVRSVGAPIGDEFYFEFRMNEGWDAALPQPIVLVHTYFDGHSYLHEPLQEGDAFRSGYQANPPELLHGDGLTVSVTNIDAAQRTATLHIVVRNSNIPPPAGPGQLLGELLGGVARDGGGWVIVNGRIVRIQPRSPLLSILDAIDQAQAGQTLRNSRAHATVIRDAYQSIANLALAQVAEVEDYREPAPAVEDQMMPSDAR